MTWKLLRGRPHVRFVPRAPLKQIVIQWDNLIIIDGVTQGLLCVVDLAKKYTCNPNGKVVCLWE